MITEAQRQEYIARGYDIIFERNNQVFVVNSQGVSSWDDEKREKFCNATGLKIFFEKDGNPVFYDPEYFEIDDYLHYIDKAESNIPQPINCHSMAYMFFECTSLQSLDISTWDVLNVTDMHSMFYNCKSLQSLDISTWDVSNVTDMHYMFYNCKSLQSLDLSKWDVSNVEDMIGAFAWCKSLQSLDLSNWDVSNAKYTGSMFEECESLQQTYNMTKAKLEDALKSGNWPQLLSHKSQQPQQSNSPHKIRF